MKVKTSIEGLKYITAGKEYEVKTGIFYDGNFTIAADNGIINCHKTECQHLNGGDWIVICDNLCSMDKGKWQLLYRQNGTLCGLISEDFTHDVSLTVNGDFAEGDKERYCKLLAAKLNAV